LYIGLWNRYFLEMFQGLTTPAKPKEPAEVHIRDGVQVPYTHDEIAARKVKYDANKTVWDKTMKVPLHTLHIVFLYMIDS
jgi:hypothetical protein